MQKHISNRGVRAKEGASILGCGQSTFWRYNATRPGFPRPRNLSARMTVWDADELVAWRDSQIQAPRRS